MTKNKLQEQILDSVEIYLPQPIFSLGQLYVVLSIAKNVASVKIFIRSITKCDCVKNYTKNIVYRELLTLTKSL